MVDVVAVWLGGMVDLVEQEVTASIEPYTRRGHHFGKYLPSGRRVPQGLGFIC